ncbi:MAG: phosphate ABC transporter permease [Acidobacteria bacterium RIFCSPLOWO2_02_FULL_59_13]|nr:MAG: phosphate ABC transporter permease [Acidobacteria bacterium RIFCSPLOWO2_02_FULL_59_13]
MEGPHRSNSFKLRTLWGSRELLYFLVWREVKVRYKQTAIGISWAILQPLMMMVIFALIFGRFAKIPSDGLPYPIFAYSALLPWIYFSQAVTRGGNSLIGDASLLRKVYFPRLIIPLSAVLAPLIDFFCSLLLLFGMMQWYGIAPTWSLLLMPVYLLIALLTALSMSLWLAPLNVRYRDIGIVIPVLMQLWMYASPVVYPVSLIPEKWRFLYSLNPMAGVIGGFRWALVGQATPDLVVLGVSVIMVLLLFCGGIAFFKRMEPTFADLV